MEGEIGGSLGISQSLEFPTFQRSASASLARREQDGDVLEILLQPRRDRHAAARFLRKLLSGYEEGTSARSAPTRPERSPVRRSLRCETAVKIL